MKTAERKAGSCDVQHRLGNVHFNINSSRIKFTRVCRFGVTLLLRKFRESQETKERWRKHCSWPGNWLIIILWALKGREKRWLGLSTFQSCQNPRFSNFTISPSKIVVIKKEVSNYWILFAHNTGLPKNST